MISLSNHYPSKPTEQQIEKLQNIDTQTQKAGSSYLIGSDKLPKVEEVVKKILDQEKSEYQKWLLDLGTNTLDFEIETEDSHLNKKEGLYLKTERWIRRNSEKVPSWEVAGPLNYNMTLEQMKNVITEKFKEMTIAGKLITNEQLAKNHDREAFYPTTHKGSNNLTRIWGAEFLKSNLIGSKNLNAAEHFLIVDDSASEIEVNVYYGEYPYVSTVGNAHILSQKIEGVKNAEECRSSDKLNKLQYKDFNDSGNIIRDSKGMDWVVDTEMKSFDLPKLNGALYHVQDYLKKRFKALSGEEHTNRYHTFKISIADLIQQTHDSKSG